MGEMESFDVQNILILATRVCMLLWMPMVFVMSGF